MAGWRKAWLSVLGRGCGGNTSSLQTHLQGHHLSLSPSSSSSSLAGYKPRGGKHGGGGGHVTGMKLAGCFFAALAFAIFYVSVLTGGGGGPADDASFTSFPATSSPSSSDLLLSWLTSNSSTAPEGKSPPLHPPIPPAVTAASGADDQQRSDARDATTASRRVPSGASDNRVVWTSGVQDLVSFAKCDVFNGRWVRDESYGFYQPKSCPLIDDDFNCHKNGRPDSDFLKWRWQPHGCDIPRLNATEFLERLRGQRIIFVGDSLNRNMWESLVCTLRHSVRDKRNLYEASGRNRFKTRGYYSFKFREYNCSVDFIRSTFLVREVNHAGKNGTKDERLKLDELDATTPAYQTANIVVFNTGHWWTHAKTSKGLNYYQEGNHVYPRLEVLDAYKKALTTWSRWVDKNIDARTQVVFRGYSLEHFRGGLWNSGGKCNRETGPIFNQTHLTEYPEKMVVLEQVLSQMKTPVIYLNISRLTDYRKDGHPSVYLIRYDTEEERMAAVTKQDCSHWCLPGVPDTWNELLYASLLQAGKGSGLCVPQMTTWAALKGITELSNSCGGVRCLFSTLILSLLSRAM